MKKLHILGTGCAKCDKLAELNEEAAVKYQYKPYDRPVIIHQDGSIGLE